MRFIHAADIHLDSPLRGLSAYQDAPADLLRGATREAFSQLVSTAIDEQIDFMVIAGDLYDGDWPDFNTGLFFCSEMGRLHRAGVPVFLLFGNHDAESHMTKALRMPGNVQCFSANGSQVHTIDKLRVALHGRSFKVRDTTENLVSSYAEPVRDYFNIGVLHTALEGYVEHPNYAPCTLEELHAKGYDYWALGHVHEHKLWTGRSTIVFPGNLQGRSIRETGRRGAVMVTVDGDRAPQVERLFVDVLRWEAVAVDVSACESLNAVGVAASRELSNLLETDAHVPRAVRVTFTGETSLHGDLFGREQELRAHVLAEIAVIGHDKLWLEKVKLTTRPRAAVTAATAGVSDGLGSDAMAELEALLQEALADEVLQKELRDDFNQMMAKAPELAHEVATFKHVREGNLAPILEDVAPGLLARLAMKE
ncbi:MAG: DNA repair exonuclease [Oxalobacteraceae bacterium]|nr:MAG: DNA repair exonuclease [Oxalobacteraceae bacterium]